MGPHPRHQRVGAYAVILQGDRILLSRLAPRVTPEELWTLPGGGIEHGEHPRDAAVREVHEETGLRAAVAEEARVYSAHMPEAWRDGRRIDAHALRIVYDGWVAAESPEPRVVEVDGSTVESAWIPVADVLAGRVPVVSLVKDALADHRPARRQQLAAYALVRRGGRVLLARAPEGRHPGSWTLPGGTVAHGEHPADALARVAAEEHGLRLTDVRLLDAHDVHLTGTVASGRRQDFHGVQLLFEADTEADAAPDLSTGADAGVGVAWVSEHDIATGEVPVPELVPHALLLEGG